MLSRDPPTAFARKCTHLSAPPVTPSSSHADAGAAPHRGSGVGRAGRLAALAARLPAERPAVPRGGGDGARFVPARGARVVHGVPHCDRADPLPAGAPARAVARLLGEHARLVRLPHVTPAPRTDGDCVDAAARDGDRRPAVHAAALLLPPVLPAAELAGGDPHGRPPRGLRRRRRRRGCLRLHRGHALWAARRGGRRPIEQQPAQHAAAPAAAGGAGGDRDGDGGRRRCARCRSSPPPRTR